jgi:pimeloyl-ACP methyl ester carboxylesterase
MALKKTWEPEGFDDYLKYFPNTPELKLSDSQDSTHQFCDIWKLGSQSTEKNLSGMSKDVTVVFVRGYLGRYMLNSLRAPVHLLRKLGFDSIIVKQKAGGSQEENVRLMLKQLKHRQNRNHFIFCAHSRGGLECLNLLKENEDISIKTKALIMSQTAHGPSYVLESILHGVHQNENYSWYRSLTEKIQLATLSTIRAKVGGEELTSKIWPNLVKTVDKLRFDFPILQTVSWSTQPTMWLDSFHERLKEIRPHCAHDGQFFLDDLIWPNIKHVLLPHLDHAQPVVGGFNFDHPKYWLTLINMVFLGSF